MTSAFRLLGVRIVAAVLLVAAATPASANDIYTVQGISVDKSAESASAARAAAQAEGQRLALTEMMKKLTLPEDWGSLPDVGDEVAQGAVRGFQVANEKTSTTRYIAELIVSFQPEPVRRILRGANIPFGETQARPAVLLPVLRRDGRVILWDEDNAWRAGWSDLDLANAMTPLILPLGDIGEINTVPAELATANDEAARAALAGLATSYGAAEVLIADATLSADGNELKIQISHRGGPVPGEPLSATIQKGDRDEAAFMRGAAQEMLNALAIQWKRQIIVRSSALSLLTVDASFATLNEWETIRSGLTSTPLVQAMEISGISSGGAEIRISHKGTVEMLGLSLAQQNVSLTREAAVRASDDFGGTTAPAGNIWLLTVRRTEAAGDDTGQMTP